MGRPKSMPTEMRFWSKVERGPGCWLWKGSRRADGYGGFAVTGRETRGAHRIAWQYANGRPVPAGLHVLHSCDTPLCVNPGHLRLGTNADNMADKVARGRSSAPWARGSLHPKAKLTEQAVREIRERHAKGENKAALARAYSVSWDLIHRVVLGVCWKHVARNPPAEGGRE